jgi:putative transposase
MKARYTYRVYLKTQQQTKAAKQFGSNRVVWNDALAIVKAAEGKWPSNSELQAIVIKEAKQTAERAWLAEVSAVPLQQSVRDLGIAFKNFFESRTGKRKGKKVGFPKFKKRSNRQTARYNKNAFKLKGNRLYLAKIGWLKVKWSRPLPSEASSVTLIKNTAGEYHVSFVVEIGQIDVEPLRSSVGVDLGIKTFAFLSTGEAVNGPDYKPLTRKVRRFQRHLSRQGKGSNRWHKTRLHIAKLKNKIANIRKDFLHKFTTKLIRENQMVSLEDLNVSGMLKNRKLSRAISEQGWSAARAMCEAKSNQYKNRTVNIISRWEPTSQTCSDCGFRWGKLDLSIRSILCISCGAEHDRDHNAAQNIDSVGAGHAHNVKRTVNTCKTGLSGNVTAQSIRPYSNSVA